MISCFSLKGITNGFEVTEQGFYYQYYDNYSQLVHTQIDIDDWQLKLGVKNSSKNCYKGILG